MHEIKADSPRSYTYEKDTFCKDFALCNLRLIPAGAQKIHLSTLRNTFLFKGGPAQFIRGIAFITIKLGGFSPLFEMHAHAEDPHLMSEFNEDGWAQFYKRVSKILENQPNVRGIFSSSWYFDPVLRTISPKLVYLRRTVTDNGGRLFYVGSDDQSIENATMKSLTRRTLYQRGKYMPTKYLVVWPRQSLIDWAGGHS